MTTCTAAYAFKVISPVVSFLTDPICIALHIQEISCLEFYLFLTHIYMYTSGYTWAEVDEWSGKVRAQQVMVMTTGTDSKCGRPPNHYLEMDGGLRMCARYREHHIIEIEGSYFLTIVYIK